MNAHRSIAVVLLACFIAPLILVQPVTGASTVLLGVYYGAQGWKMGQSRTWKPGKERSMRS